MDTPQQYPTMWTTGYLANGMKVSFTFPIRNEFEACKQALEITNKLLADGFTANDPTMAALEAGEGREQVGYIVRRNQKNTSDNTVTPVIDVYPTPEATKLKFMSIYLDTPEDVKAFESAFGLSLAALPILPGKKSIERDEEGFTQFVTKVAQPVFAIYKANPRYNPEETDLTKKKPKRLFVKWEAATPPVPASLVPPPAAAAQAGEPPKATPEADDREVNERRKAVTALDNEELTVYSTHYNPLHNGKGFPRWEAMARIADGVSVPLVVWTEHETLIKKAGYEWPRDAEDLAIPVITEMVGSERRIKAVKALDDSWMLFEPKIAQKGAVDRNSGNPDEFSVWVFDKVMLLTKLGKDQFACKIPYEERGATVDKMHRENEFAKVSGLDGAVEMVVNRLKAHRKQVA